MASMPFALSVHSLVSSVGADAGFAAIIGLAILSLLFFAHARETAHLREEASELAQRLQEAEARLGLAQRALAAPAPGSTITPAPRPALEMVGQPVPAAPAGVAAPALAAATRFIPVGSGSAAPDGRATSPPVPISSAPRSTPPPQPVAVPGTPAPASAGVTQAPVSPSPRPAPTAAASPSPVASPPAGPEGPQVPSGPPVPAPATVAALRTVPSAAPGGPNGLSSASVGQNAASPPDAPVRAQEGRPPPPPRPVLATSGPVRHTPSVKQGIGMLLVALVVIGAVVAVVILTSGTGNQSAALRQASNAPGPPKSAFNPAHVTVAVLNGTATNQLAHHIADRLAAVGYNKGQIATASNQTVSSTVVAYLPGSGDRAAALHVAKALHLRRRAVAPVDQDARAVACPPPGVCTANVVVTVGSDLSPH